MPCGRSGFRPDTRKRHPTPTFRLADYTADRDSHPALKICRRKFITFFEQRPHQPVAISHNLQYLCNPQPEGLPPSTSTCRSSRRDVSASSESNSPDATSPDGGIGRRAGLKHQWSNPCRFDPGSGYKQKRLSIALSLFCLYLLLNPSHFVTAPVRGMPPSAHAPVGRPRCFNFLRKSR